jgi:hypothetical protein
MNRDILDRIRREAAITVAGARETILAIADRVNRKTQALKLQWRAAEASSDLGLHYQKVGRWACEALGDHAPSAPPDPQRAAVLQAQLEGFHGSLQTHRRELAGIERRIAEIEAEALSDDLHRFQLDLGARALTIERLTVSPEATAVGLSPAGLALPPGVRVMAVFRGPALLTEQVPEGLRAGDVVFLLGPRADLQRHRAQFHLPARITA